MWAQGQPYFFGRDQVPFGDPSMAPQAMGMGQAGYPPNANAWPNITPYGPVLDQHYVNNGFWYRRIINGQSKYFATLEALISSTGAPPHEILGEQGVNDIPRELIDNGITFPGFTPLRTGQFNETEGRPNNPDRNVDDTTSGGGNGNNNTQAFVTIFNPKNAGILQQKIGSGGVRGSWGWWNPEGTGLMVQGFWQGKATSTFQAGDTTLAQQLVTARTPELIDYATQQIRPYGLLGLALPGADRDADGLNGVVVPYDLYVSLEYASSVYGGNLDWYFAPMYDRDHFKIRGLAGARVMTVNERFSFDAMDSGLGYTLSPVDTGTTGGNNNGNSGTNPFNLAPSEFDDAPYGTPSATGPGSPIRSYLMSRSEGFFAGPEAGVRLDLGGDRFKIWTQSKFGLLAYQSTRKISGYNIGDHYNIINTAVLETNSGLPQDPDVNGDGIPDNPTRAAGIAGTSFSESKRSTSVAPLFEQGVFMEAPLLSYVPYINRMSMFNNAEFQAGYTFLVLGGVYRPTDISWKQFPDTPTFGGDRYKFYTQNWSLGVNWTY